MKQQLDKIFVSAYACEPGLGSEIGVGWHWILEMSKYFELWVLTRKSNQNTIESWMKERGEIEKIHFVYFDLPKYLRFWKKGMRGVRLYYTLWQLLTNRIVKKVMIENNIRAYHMLTYGNALWPVSSYGMKQFFVWGPTGGVDTIPAEYSKLYGTKSRFVEFVRRMVVKSLPINIGFQKRCKNADLILCKSWNMYEAVSEKYREKAKMFTDVAVELRNINITSKKKQDGIVRYLVVGKLDAWRGFDILIEAFEKAYQVDKNIRLEILGRGNDKERLSSLISNKGMEELNVMTDEVSMDEYLKKVSFADVIVNSSLKEGAVTVSFDSMSLSKPFICVDTGGYTRYFKNDYAIVLKRSNRNQLIDDMAEAIVKMTDGEYRETIGRKSYEAGQKYTWNHKGKAIFEEIMRAWNETIEE